jgi:hypothetical protein
VIFGFAGLVAGIWAVRVPHNIAIIKAVARMATYVFIAVTPCIAVSVRSTGDVGFLGSIKTIKARFRLNTGPPDLAPSTKDQLIAFARILICLALSPLQSALNLWYPDFAMV